MQNILNYKHDLFILPPSRARNIFHFVQRTTERNSLCLEQSSIMNSAPSFVCHACCSPRASYNEPSRWTSGRYHYQTQRVGCKQKHIRLLQTNFGHPRHELGRKQDKDHVSPHIRLIQQRHLPAQDSSALLSFEGSASPSQSQSHD